MICRRGCAGYTRALLLGMCTAPVGCRCRTGQNVHAGAGGYGWESVGTPNLPLTFPDTPTGSTWHVEHLDGDVVGDNHEEGKDASVSA